MKPRLALKFNRVRLHDTTVDGVVFKDVMRRANESKCQYIKKHTREIQAGYHWGNNTEYIDGAIGRCIRFSPVCLPVVPIAYSFIFDVGNEATVLLGPLGVMVGLIALDHMHDQRRGLTIDSIISKIKDINRALDILEHRVCGKCCKCGELD